MADVSIRPNDAGARLRVQCWERDVGDVLALQAVVGVAWPTTVGEVVGSACRVLCIGASDWLVTHARLSAEALAMGLSSLAKRPGVAIVDMSQALRVLTLEGGGARDTLAKGCGLDLHPREFRVGTCARTRFAQVPVVLECITETRFDCYVTRSYLPYLSDWLGQEFPEGQPR